MAKGAGGEPLHIAGVIHEASITIQGKAFVCGSIAVIRGLVYDLVLGRDFCCRFGTIIDDQTGVLLIGGLSIPLPLYTDIWPRRARVMLVANVTIPPRSTMLVGAKVSPVGGESRSLVAIQGVIEPSTTPGKADVLIPREIVTSDSSGVVPLQLTNTAYEETRILRGTDVGTFFPFFPNGENEFQLCPDGGRVSDSVSSAVTDGGEPRGTVGTETETVPLSETDMDVNNSALSSEGKKRLQDVITAYSDIFSRYDGDIGHTHLVEHTIDTGGASPIRQPPRRIPVSVRAEIEEQKERMLRDGIIEPSTSAWSSPVVLARKKDGTFRFCVDLRAVNAVTKGHAHPLPRVDSTLDCLAGARFYSTLDLASGYWQVGIAPEDREKTAFSTGTGLHQFKVMAMGLKNASATFQRLMELVLSGLDAKTCLVYLDDLVIFSRTEEEHLNALEAVFERIRAAGLKLKPQKCHIAKREVTFLGHLVTENGIRPDPKNVEKVLTWPEPESAEEMASFLGLCGYYGKFIANYTGVCKPLRDASLRPGRLQWSDEMREAFERLKRALASPPVLALPTFRGTFILYTDACNTSVGSVLSELVDGIERVIAYDSKVLTKPQVKWPTYDKELWAVVHAIRRFRQYTVGTKFVVVTDHKPLANIPGSIAVERDGTGRRGRWAVELSSFDFEVRVKAGSTHTNADALSRRPPGDKAGHEVSAVSAPVHSHGITPAAVQAAVSRARQVSRYALVPLTYLVSLLFLVLPRAFLREDPISSKSGAAPSRTEDGVLNGSPELDPVQGGTPTSWDGGTALAPGESPEPDPVQGGLSTPEGIGSAALPSVAVPISSVEEAPSHGSPGHNAGAAPNHSPSTADGTDLRRAQEEDPSLVGIGACLREGLPLNSKGHGEWSGVVRQHGRKIKMI